MVTDNDKEIVDVLIKTLPTAFIGGSYLVAPENANDIDVLCLHSVMEQQFLDYLTDCQGFHKVVEKAQLTDYGIGEEDNYEVTATFRKDGVNLVIIKDLFWPAYVAGSKIIAAYPERYQTRPERVDLHMYLKSTVRQMFNPDNWERIMEEADGFTSQ